MKTGFRREDLGLRCEDLGLRREDWGLRRGNWELRVKGTSYCGYCSVTEQ